MFSFGDICTPQADGSIPPQQAQVRIWRRRVLLPCSAKSHLRESLRAGQRGPPVSPNRGVPRTWHRGKFQATWTGRGMFDAKQTNTEGWPKTMVGASGRLLGDGHYWHCRRLADQMRPIPRVENRLRIPTPRGRRGSLSLLCRSHRYPATLDL